MTRIAIVGGGPGATVHAEAVRATPGVHLAGVGGRPGSATGLAAALDVEDLALDALLDRAGAVIVAVPPDEVRPVMEAATDRVRAVMVESPIASSVAAASVLLAALPTPSKVMTAANLLHAPAAREMLRAVAEMTKPHHLALRAVMPRPTWGFHAAARRGAGPVIDPGARQLALLLAAAAAPVRAVSATITSEDADTCHARLRLDLADGRRATAGLGWSPGEARCELEVADADGVVTLDVSPLPTLSRDGAPPSGPIPDPLVALGFVDQVRRLAAVARGDAPSWADLEVGRGVLCVVDAAARSAAADGATMSCAVVGRGSTRNLLGET